MPKKKFSPTNKSKSNVVKQVTKDKLTIQKQATMKPTRELIKDTAPTGLSARKTRLLVDTLINYRQNMAQLIGLSGVVFFTSSMIQAYQNRYESNIDLAFIIFGAGVMSFMAMGWFNIYQHDAKSMRMSHIYNTANRHYLPYLTVAVIQSILLLPIVFGVFLSIIAMSLGLTYWMQVLAVVMVLIAMILSIWYSQAGFVVLDYSISSIKALRLSQQMVKGQLRKIVLAYAVFVVLCSVLVGAIGFLSAHIKVLETNWLAGGLLGGIIATLIVSLGSVFSYNLYQNVKVNYTPPSKPAPKVIKGRTSKVSS